MRVGLLAHASRGGSGVFASELAAALAALGDDVHLFALGVPPRLARDRRGVKVHVTRAPKYPLFEAPPHVLALASGVIAEHARGPFDVLHAHYAVPFAVVAQLAKSAVPSPPAVVVTLHGTDASLVGATEPYRPVVRHALSAAEALTAVSASLAEEARARFDLPPSTELRVLPGFVDTQRFRPAEGRDSEAVRVVHVSNFRPLKRVPWMIEAVATSRALREVELWFIGDGPERSRAETRASELGLRARFFGERDDVHELLAQADILALASERESFGLAVLEAMAAGLAVLAPAVGGLREVVRDGEDGLLVAPNSSRAWVEALERLVSDRELRRALGRSARRRAVSRFEGENLVRRHRALYSELLAR